MGNPFGLAEKLHRNSVPTDLSHQLSNENRLTHRFYYLAYRGPTVVGNPIEGGQTTNVS
jgi:hypothetical protein